MQAQSNLRIFRRIGRGIVYRDLAEIDLLGPFACHLLITDGLVTQIFECQRVHIVTGGGTVQHIGFEHGVVGHPAQGDVVIRQHTHVVLEILSQLGLGRVFQQGFQPCQDCIAWQLCRGTGIGMGQRDVGRLDPTLRTTHRQRDPHNRRIHVIETGGLGIKGKQLGLLQALIPGIKLCPVEYRLIGTCRAGSGRGFSVCRHHTAIVVQQFRQPALELHLTIKPFQGLDIGGTTQQCLWPLFKRHIALNCHQLA